MFLQSGIVPGEKCEVDIPPGMMGLAKNVEPNSWIVVHTHPDASPFSVTDVRSAVSVKATHTEMVIGRGNIVYSFEVKTLRGKSYKRALGNFDSLVKTWEWEPQMESRFTPGERQALKPAFDRMTNYLQADKAVRLNHGSGKYKNRRPNVSFIDQGVEIRIENGSIYTAFTDNDLANQAFDVQRVMFKERFGCELRAERLYI